MLQFIVVSRTVARESCRSLPVSIVSVPGIRMHLQATDFAAKLRRLMFVS